MLIAFANVCAYVYLKPALPDVDSLRDVQLQVPLRVYTRDGRLIASIGEQRRIPVRYDQLPPKLIQAFLATEDDRFFRHHGVDWEGILRAALANARAGGISQGASTITMQVARDMFLTPQRDMKRKMSEVYISLLMETEFTKEEIFSLYVNKIFLGQRAYGVAAAAEVYFGKTLDQLSIAEMATLAGIPTAPSSVNPVANAQAATRAARARARPHARARTTSPRRSTRPPKATPDGEPAAWPVHRGRRALCGGNGAQRDAGQVRRQHLHRRLPGIHDHRFAAEPAATVALRTGLLEYDRRHGWRGATAKVDLSKVQGDAGLDAELEEFPAVGGLRPAIVESVEGKSAQIYVKDIGRVTLPWEKLSWARRELPEEKIDRAPAQASEIMSRGDVIYTVGNTPRPLQFVQVPEAQSALVAMDPNDGAVVALVGGFDLFPEQVQPRDPGEAPAGLGFQAVRVCRGVRQGLHAGERGAGCAHRDRRGRHGAGLAAEGRRGPLRGAGAPARSDGPFDQSGLGAPGARHRHRLHLELRAAVRLRQEPVAAGSDHGARAPRNSARCRWRPPTRPSPMAAFR